MTPTQNTRQTRGAAGHADTHRSDPDNQSGNDTDGFGAATASARTAISDGYDLFEQLLAGQRRLIDQVLAEQRHFVDTLLTAPGAR